MRRFGKSPRSMFEFRLGHPKHNPKHMVEEMPPRWPEGAWGEGEKRAWWGRGVATPEINFARGLREGDQTRHCDLSQHPSTHFYNVFGDNVSWSTDALHQVCKAPARPAKIRSKIGRAVE